MKKINDSQIISSKDNPLYKKLKLLLSAKGIKEHKLFFLMGDKLIKEFTKSKNKNFKVHLVVCSDKYFAKFPFNTITLSQNLFNELDVLGTHYPLFVLECDDFDTLDLNAAAKPTVQPEKPIIEVVTPLGDPRNLGALVRSALGFNVNSIILTQESCHPYLPQCVKASSGAVLKMNFTKAEQKISEIQQGKNYFALDLEGEEIHKTKWPKSLRLLVGEEGQGLQLHPKWNASVKKIKIPTQEIESLNATVSTSIALWEIYKNQK